MKFPFYKYPAAPNGSGHPWRVDPRISINISTAAKPSGIDVLALIDSGASMNLFTAEIADVIGIDRLEDGQQHKFYGIGNQEVTAYNHEVIMDIGGFRFQTSIYFSRNVGRETVLLGMIGFFDRFVVTFDRPRESIELKPVKLK